MSGIPEETRREVLGWPGVEAKPHRVGGVEFRVGGHEIGHLHGSGLADLPFPVRVRKKLVANDKARPHHLLTKTGWVSYPIRDEEDVPGVLELFRLSYERLTAQEKNEAQA